MATDVHVVIPWRPTPDREPAFEYVQSFWTSLDLPVTTHDSDPAHRFNLAQARNRGVARAHADSAKVVIVCDADTFCDPGEALDDALWIATLGRVVLPYDEYRSLGALGSHELLRGAEPTDCTHTTLPPGVACSGIYITTPETWFSIGGMDERFTVWSPEDHAFRLAHQALLGDQVRMTGNAYAMHHQDQPSKASGPEYDACVALYQRYLVAAGDAEAMRALIAERGDANGVGSRQLPATR